MEASKHVQACIYYNHPVIKDLIKKWVSATWVVFFCLAWKYVTVT